MFEGSCVGEGLRRYVLVSASSGVSCLVMAISPAPVSLGAAAAALDVLFKCLAPQL